MTNGRSPDPQTSKNWSSLVLGATDYAKSYLIMIMIMMGFFSAKTTDISRQKEKGKKGKDSTILVPANAIGVENGHFSIERLNTGGVEQKKNKIQNKKGKKQKGKNVFGPARSL